MADNLSRIKEHLVEVMLLVDLEIQSQEPGTPPSDALLVRITDLEAAFKSFEESTGIEFQIIDKDITAVYELLATLKAQLDRLDPRVTTLELAQDDVFNTMSALATSLNTISSKIASLEDWINNYQPPTNNTGGGTVNVSGVPYSAASLGLLPGQDITAKLNQVCNGGTILFDGGAYIINGKVDAKGTNFIVLKGSNLRGSGHIDNFMLTAGDYKVFSLDIKLTRVRVNGDRSYWSWWGAISNNDMIDNAPLLQRGIDVVIDNPTMPRTFYGTPGVYYTQNGLVVYKWDGIDYRFCDIVIEGDAGNWKNSEEYGTWIWNKNPQSFGINFQRTRSCDVRNVGIRGEAKYSDHYGGYAGMFRADYAKFTENYNKAENKNVLDTRFAMYAGIVVDAFANGPAYNGTWPGWESWNRGTGQTGGASALNLDGVYIWNFTACVALSPSGTTYNAEDISMERVYFRSAKMGISIGQDQNKNIQLNNFVAYQVHTPFDGVTYGKGIGAQLIASNGDMANCNRIVNISSQRFPWVFNNLFTEEFYRIGDIDHGAMPVVFNNLQFEYVGNSDRISAMPSNILKGNNVVFNGGYIRTPHAPTFTRPVFVGKDITFNQITLENAPIFPGTVETTNGNQNGYFHQVNLLAWESRLGATSVSSQNLEPFRNYPLYGQFTISSQMIYDNAFVKIKYDETKYDHSYRLGGGDLSNINKSNADFKISHPGVYPITGLNENDYLITQYQNQVQALGRVVSVDYSSGMVKLTDVPDNLVAGNYIVWGNYIRRVQRPFIGTTEKGTYAITKIKSPFGFPEVGDRIEAYVDFSNNSTPMYITKVDPGAGTASVSRTLLKTAADVNFAMSDPEIEITALDSFNSLKPVLKGTKIILK